MLVFFSETTSATARFKRDAQRQAAHFQGKNEVKQVLSLSLPFPLSLSLSVCVCVCARALSLILSLSFSMADPGPARPRANLILSF